MATKKFYNEKANLSVYVANLEEYVNGKLVGDWISLPIKENDWKNFLKTIGNPEEITIHDFEDNLELKGLKIGEYMSIEELNELCERIEGIDLCEVDTFNALYEALGDFEEALECFEVDNYVFYSNMTMEEVAREHIEDCYDIPSYLENYIDYKAFARDMDCEGFYYNTAYGVVEIL